MKRKQTHRRRLSLEIITSRLMIYLRALKAQKDCDSRREIFCRLPLLHTTLVSEQLTSAKVLLQGSAVQVDRSTRVGVDDSGYCAPHSSLPFGTLPLLPNWVYVFLERLAPPPGSLVGSHMTQTCQSRSEVGLLLLLERDTPFLLGWLGGRMKAWAAGATFAITWGVICGLLNKSRSDSRKEKDPVDVLWTPGSTQAWGQSLDSSIT